MLLLGGCGYVGLAHDSTFDSNYSNEEESQDNIYVSSDEVLFKSYDAQNSVVEFLKIGSDEIVSYAYDGTTVIYDKFQQPMSMEQLKAGDIVNIAYNSTVAKVGAIVESPNSFKYDNVGKYTVGNSGQSFFVGDEIFSIDENTKVFSGSELIQIEQLITNDSLTIQGEGHSIFSIRVDEGHGYLELQNEEALIGGWIEVGSSLISQVEEGMLFTVPEGNYSVKLTNEGIEEYRDVSIIRNDIAILDIGDIEPVGPQKGVVSFSILPETAEVFVDDNYVNTAYSIRLPVGIHKITASAAGFDTISTFFEVTGLNQSVNLELTQSTATAGSTVSGNNINKNLYAYVTVEAPVGVEVYEDNIYKGITPSTYQKNSGTHTLTFRKSGYKTTSYTVVFEDDGKDQTLSFPDLEVDDSNSQQDQNSSSIQTVSGNSLSLGTVSGNTISGNSLSLGTVSGNTISGNSLN